MAASDAYGKRSLFRRGLNATRLVLAFAVTVVIVTIVVYAVVVVSRKDELTLSVAGGIIYVRPPTEKIHVRPPMDPQQLGVGLTFSVKANNPSGRLRFYYTNIDAHVRLKNGTNSTDTFTFAHFPLGDDNMDVAPVTMLQRDANVDVQYFSKFSAYFDELRTNKSSIIITDVMLKLNGTLTIGLYSVRNSTSAQTYYCYPLTIGAASSASADAAEDVPCQKDDPTK